MGSVLAFQHSPFSRNPKSPFDTLPSNGSSAGNGPENGSITPSLRPRPWCRSSFPSWPGRGASPTPIGCARTRRSTRCWASSTSPAPTPCATSSSASAKATSKHSGDLHGSGCWGCHGRCPPMDSVWISTAPSSSAVGIKRTARRAVPTQSGRVGERAGLAGSFGRCRAGRPFLPKGSHGVPRSCPRRRRAQ